MLNAKRPYFFEGFNPASSSQRLKIPPTFVKHMEGRTSGTITLMGPSGNTWHVELIQHNDNLFFHNGWAAFVQDHSIERGDALVFRYDGNLQFTVQVFDQSSCEKDSAFSAKCSQDTIHFDELMGRKRGKVSGASCLDDIVESMPKKMRGSGVLSECISRNYEEGWRCNDMVSGTELCQATMHTMPLQSEIFHRSSEGASQNGYGKESELCTSGRGGMLTLSASEADGLARSFTSSHPNFTKTMKRFNVSGSYTLNIPYQFSTAHLPKCKVKIILHNLKGESWTVNSIPTVKVHMSHTLCGGWGAFVRDNNISEGDNCIFELIGRCEFRVYILRVKQEGPGCENGNKHLPKKMRDSINLEDSKANGRISQSSTFYYSLEAGGGKNATINRFSLDEKQVSYTRGCMSMKSAPEEKRAAQAFISSFPHFVRVMKKFNISGSYTLKIPYQFSMAHLPNCKTEIVLRNLRGQCWVVNSVPSTRVQTLHTFCGGWMAFVRDNDIQMGDICIFELIGKCEMRVHVSGFGKNMLECEGENSTSNELTLVTLGNRPL